MAEVAGSVRGVSVGDVDVEPSALPRPQRLVEDVTRVLRDAIINGTLKPGTELLQVDIAEQLGVSRTPLREALRILENDGLVRVKNRNRTVEVNLITSADLLEMYQIREVIDGLAARLAARNGLPDEILTRLRQLIAEMRAAAHPYDPARRTAAHIEFHSLIAEHCGSPRVEPFLPLIRVSSAALYTPFITDAAAAQLVRDGELVTHADLLERAQHVHGEIIDAIEERDPRKAETIARRHIASTLKAVPELDRWRQAIADATVDHDH